jgi:enoyl-CoA hydratase/carnithine racemase
MRLVESSDQDGIRVLAIARPPVNAIDLALVRALGDVLVETAGARNCRGVVLTGGEGIFCAGIDVKTVPHYDAPTRQEMIRGINRTILGLYGLDKPTVAAIGGHALGGGLVLALACDFRLAAAGHYRLGLTEITAGIPFPAGPMTVVLAELDHSAARSLVLSGQVFEPTAPSAAAFLDELVEPERLRDAAVARAASLAAAPAYAVVKRQLKAEALRRLERIVADDADPLLRTWP